MPYKSKSLFLSVINHLDLEMKIPAMQHVIEEELNTYTNVEMLELMMDLSKLRKQYLDHADLRDRLGEFIDQISGNRKENFLEAENFSPYQLSIEELIILSEYYNKKHGIKIHVQSLADNLEQSEELSNQPLHGMHPYPCEANLAIEELLQIQKKLNKDEYIGYIYTNGYTTGKHHVEIFIVGSEQIIKPVRWKVRPKLVPYPHTTELHLKDFGLMEYSTDLISFLDKVSIPQAGGAECGSLSMVYLKNLLKDNARQLKEFTLSFPYYNKSQELNYFFLPSPHVLRYSQSKLYNKLLSSMLEHDQGCMIQHPGIGDFSLPSLKTMLDQTIIKAQAKDQDTIVSQAQSVLKELPMFKERWLQQYQMITKKHNKMDTKQYNQYLSYTTQRMHRITSVLLLERDSSAIKLLDTMLASKALGKSTVEIYSLLETVFRLTGEKDSPFRFKSQHEQGYFLSKVPNIYFLDLISSMNLLIKMPSNFIRLTQLLKPVQTMYLAGALAQSQAFKRDTLSKVDNLQTMNQWLLCLRIPKQKTIQFLKSYLPKEAITTLLEASVRDQSLIKYLSMFTSQEEFYHFLKEHLEEQNIPLQLAPLSQVKVKLHAEKSSKRPFAAIEEVHEEQKITPEPKPATSGFEVNSSHSVFFPKKIKPLASSESAAAHARP